MSSIYNREILIQQISNQDTVWDVFVIGGGASGLGIALEAVTRGYKTLLVEQADFAKGTSGKSTKLVHGGVRYLAQGNIKLVREASIERGLLQNNASHLVKLQQFILPVYSYWDRIKYTLGLKLYDRIAGTLSLGRSFFISTKQVEEQLPSIKNANLKGAVVYHDGQFDDARLAINLAQTIIEKGGVALNYAQVKSLTKNKEGKLCGATIVEVESGKTISVKAQTIINATGVFVDAILQMDVKMAEPSIRVSQGIHLVLSQKFHQSSQALMIPKTSDGRVLFAVPWHNKVVVGTTDTLVDGPTLEPLPLEKEIDFILETAANYYKQQPTRADVLSVFVGLRPLVSPKKGKIKTKEISRSHKIMLSNSQLFSILGGKWTTYRKMGEDMINKVEHILKWKHRSSVTKNLEIHGCKKETNWNDPLYFYGTDADLIQQKMKDEEWIGNEIKIHPQQIIWAIENEMARTLEDVLSRRTRLLLLDAKACKQIAPQVATIMAHALEKNNEWVENQVQTFNKLANGYALQ